MTRIGIVTKDTHKRRERLNLRSGSIRAKHLPLERFPLQQTNAPRILDSRSKPPDKRPNRVRVVPVACSNTCLPERLFEEPAFALEVVVEHRPVDASVPRDATDSRARKASGSELVGGGFQDAVACLARMPALRPTPPRLPK